jgi:hypothetical protein
MLWDSAFAHAPDRDFFLCIIASSFAMPLSFYHLNRCDSYACELGVIG